jgi:hypothetical protein
MSEMEMYFEYEKSVDSDKVKFTIMKLKGNVPIWWDFVSCKRVNLNKENIKTWRKMLSKMRGKFLLVDYKQLLFNEFRI